MKKVERQRQTEGRQLGRGERDGLTERKKGLIQGETEGDRKCEVAGEEKPKVNI